MTGQVPSKLRLVRCPKCHRVLPEQPNVPVYQCGGCGTVLQAKKRKVTSEDAEPPVTESVTIHNNELENITSDQKAQNFSQNDTIPLKPHHLVEINSENNQTETQIFNGENSIVLLENKESTSNIDEDEYLCKNDDLSTEFSEELVQHPNLESTAENEKYKDTDSSTEFSENLLLAPNIEIDECLLEGADSSTKFSENLVLSPDIEIDECLSEDADSSTKFSGNIEKEEILSENINGEDENKNDHSKEKPQRCVSFSSELVYLTEINHFEHEEDENETFMEPKNEINQKEVLSVVETNIESNEDFHDRASFYNHEQMSSIYKHEEDENETFTEPKNEINQKDFLSVIETNIKSNEDFHDSASFYDHERMSSMDTFDNIVALREMPESPITRSYYDFYGSGSSCDGNDDQVPDRKFPLSKRNREFSNKFKGNPEIQGQNGYISSSSSGNRRSAHHEMKIEEVEKIVHQPRVPLYSQNREFDNLNGKYSDNEMSVNSHLPNKREYLGVENSNKYIGNPEIQGKNGYFSSSSSGNRRSAHNEMKIEKIGLQPGVSLYPQDHEFNYSNGNYSNDEMNSHLPNKREYLEVEKMELLKKVHELQDQLNRTYISEGKQNGNFSRHAENQIHPYHDNFIYNNQEIGRYREEKRPSRVPFSSEFSNHRSYGEFLLNNTYDAKLDTSNVIINSGNAIKVREEGLYLGKKHSLPVAGGAPFLQCYGCSEVLQIPADFLLFKRKYHKLKCGGCSAILKFSLLNETNISIYIDHGSKYFSCIDRDSFYLKSFSTEEPQSPIEPQFDDFKRNFSGKSNKKGNKFTNFVRNFGSIRSSSRRSQVESLTSEIEEIERLANSPLHKLMGYQSATFLLKPDVGY